MDTYVCLLVAPDRRIVTVESYTAANDGDATRKAEAMLMNTPAAHGYELWQKGRKIASVNSNGNSGGPRPSRSD
jgi:hypothetical protein